MDKPSQVLAKRIVERLVREGLIGADAANILQLKLAEGKLKADDWRLPVEIAQDPRVAL